MKDFAETARDLVVKWEHGDEEHRKWLRDMATPDIVAALAHAFYEGHMEERDDYATHSVTCMCEDCLHG